MSSAKATATATATATTTAASKRSALAADLKELSPYSKLIKLNHAQEAATSTISDTTSIIVEEKNKLTHEKVKQYKMRRLIKENHQHQIQHVAFNRVDAESRNILATIGANQLSIYDNEHFGTHLDLMCMYENVESYPAPPTLSASSSAATPTTATDTTARAQADSESKDGDNESDTKSDKAKSGQRKMRKTTATMSNKFNDFVWMQEEGDALIAAASNDSLIHIISVARTSVIQILRGHSAPVCQLEYSVKKPQLLFSLDKDGIITVWNVKQEQILCTLHVDATTFSIDKQGTSLLIGTEEGSILSFQIPTFPTQQKEITVAECKQVYKKQSSKSVAKTRFDNIVFVNQDEILIHSNDGVIVLYQLSSSTVKRTYQVDEVDATQRVRLDVSHDQQFFVIGNNHGELHIYSLTSNNKVVATLSHHRATGLLRSATFSHDQQTIIYTTNDLIWRWDYQAESEDNKDSGKESSKKKKQEENEE